MPASGVLAKRFPDGSSTVRISCLRPGRIGLKLIVMLQVVVALTPHVGDDAWKSRFHVNAKVGAAESPVNEYVSARLAALPLIATCPKSCSVPPARPLA